jgi:hypothetical protein
MLMDDPKNLAKSALDYTFANSSSETMKSYVQRGRHLKDMSEDDLLALYKSAFLAWSKDIFDDELSQRSSDAGAELELRGIEPPSDGLKGALGEVMKDLRSLLQSADPSAFAPMIDAYRDAVSKKQ